MSTNTVLAPSDAPQAIGAYVQGILIPPGSTVIHTAGQVGTTPEGKTPDSFGEQCEQAFKNVLAVVKAGGMGPEDIVKTTLFVVAGQDLDAMRAARSKIFGSAKPASTLLVISGLATPNLLFEVEAIAAKVL